MTGLLIGLVDLVLSSWGLSCNLSHLVNIEPFCTLNHEKCTQHLNCTPLNSRSTWDYFIIQKYDNNFKNTKKSNNHNRLLRLIGLKI